jgi:hypothetical protein
MECGKIKNGNLSCSRKITAFTASLPGVGDADQGGKSLPSLPSDGDLDTLIGCMM